MSVAHKIWDAVPADGGGPVGKSLLRSAATARFPYIIADTENPSDLVCVDPVTGAAVVDILYRGALFHYDASDGLTAADGTTVIVSNEGRRYKIGDGAVIASFAVLDNSLAAPPASSSFGDSYLVAAAATGPWAGHSGDVAVETSRGWRFITLGVGKLLYVESFEAYVHRKTDGSWAFGLGNLTIGPNTVPLSAAINFGKRFIVENQTTNAPPGTSSVGTAYIIGPIPTGTWAGNAGKLAICEVANQFTIYSPTNGWAAYDKAQNNEFRFNGTAWVSAIGAMVGAQRVVTASGSETQGGSGTYTYSATTAPTTATLYNEDTATLSYTARKAGARLRFTYRLGGAGNTTKYVPALFMDSISAAQDWSYIESASGMGLLFVFETTSPDASSHTYKVRFLDIGIGAPRPLTRRIFSVEEFA